MILLSNFFANEFRYFHATNECYKLVFILQWFELQYFAFPMGKINVKEIDFIWFSFLTSLAFIEVYVLAIATCVICFTGKNFTSSYKCSNVELICSACVKRNTMSPQ